MYTCSFCQKDITEQVMRTRHYSSGNVPSRVYCNRDHQVLDRKRNEEYKAMSQKGREARTQAVKESNHLKPRRKAGAPKGSQNAKKYRYPGEVVRLSGDDAELLHDFFALEGNFNPTSADVKNAVHYAIQQVYGRKIEREGAIII